MMMMAHRTSRADSATTAGPVGSRSAILAPKHLHDLSAVRNGGGQGEAVRTSAAAPGHRFGSIGIYPNSEHTHVGQSVLRAPTSGSTPAADGRTIVRQHPHRFSASVKRVPSTPTAQGHDWSVLRRPAPTSASAVRRDSARGRDAGPAAMDIGSLLALTTQAPITGLREPRPGETVRLPDITLQPQAMTVRSDSIAGVLGYNPTVTKTGADPTGFGHELLHTSTLSGITVTPSPGSFAVAATVDQQITFQVRSSTGPGGEIDIASDTDADITAGNYVRVADDLKPDMADLNGRPPRTQFWAEDLTIMHERFHADEDVEFVRTAVVGAQTWLNAQTAANVAQVNGHLAGLPAKIKSDADAANPAPAYEERAYLNGVGLYQARSDAIRAKGAAGGYPAGPGPAAGGLSRGAKVGIGIAGGALIGAGLGAFGGGIGAAIGAGIGALVGLIGGLLV